jgi:autotransporter-associated beta strand protein
MNGTNQTVGALTSVTGLGGAGVIANLSSTNSVLTVNSTGSSTYSGLLVDAGAAGTLGLVKSGTGTLTLAGNSSYTGGTTVTGGTLIVTAGGNTGLAYSGTLGVIAGAANGVFQMSNLDPSVVSGLVVGQKITGFNMPATGAYITSIVNATTISYSTFTTGTNSASQVESTAAYAGSGLGSGNVTVSGGELVAANQGALIGAGTLLISGGTLSSTVANANVGGDLGMSSGNLNANGTAAGSYTLAANKNFSLSGGTVTLTLDLSSGVAGGSDQFLGSGTGTFSLTNLTVSFDLDGGFDYASTYNVLSGFTSGTVTNLTFTGYDTANYVASIDTAGVLSFTAIPEPAASVLFGAGVSALLFVRRRRM